MRLNFLMLIYKTLGFFGLISGSLHCFMHIVALLFRKNRHHWVVMRLIKVLLSRVRARVRTLRAFSLLVVGKFNGKMRTGKKLLQIGRQKLKLITLKYRLEYVSTCTHTRWGVFGLHAWAQFKSPFRYYLRGNRNKSKKSPTILQYYRTFEQNRKLGVPQLSNTHKKTVVNTVDVNTLLC